MFVSLHLGLLCTALLAAASSAKAAPLTWYVTNPQPGVGEEVVLEPYWDGLKPPYALMFDFQEYNPVTRQWGPWRRMSNYCDANPCKVKVHLTRAASINFRAVVVDRRDRTRRALTYAQKMQQISWRNQPPTPPNRPPTRQALSLTVTVEDVTCTLAPVEYTDRGMECNATKPIMTRWDGRNFIADNIKISYRTTGYETSGFGFRIRLLYGTSVIPPDPHPIGSGSVTYSGVVVTFTPKMTSITAVVEWDGIGSNPMAGDSRVYPAKIYIPLTFKEPPKR